MKGWRVWRAFEQLEGRDNTPLWAALAESCRDATSGRIDGVEFDLWMDVILEQSHQRGEA